MIVYTQVTYPKTEAEWLASVDPPPMLCFPHSARKLRLFACACCRSIWHLLSDERSRKAIDVAELYADGHASAEELAAARAANDEIPSAWDVHDWNATNAVHEAAGPDAKRAAEFCSHATAVATADVGSLDYAVATKAIAIRRHAEILRDIVGNPFRPVFLDPLWLRWKDGLILQIAQKVYDEGKVDNMPILADALIDAGCNNEDVLNHCRQQGEHVRGCWVVDLLTGRQ